jgi:PTS system nitrogen regulatory IIA component
MNFDEIIDPACCEVKVTGRTRDDALASLANCAVRSTALVDVDPQVVRDALVAREDQGTTGFGNEIALPHARVPGLDRFIVFVGVAKWGIPFNAMDKKRVRLFFVILAPQGEVTQHLRILATISRALGHTNMKKELLSARSATALGETMLRHLGSSARIVPGAAAQKTMKLMLINLYVEEYLYDVLQAMVELGVDGATIIDSTGMGQYVSSVPLFAEFIGFMKENRNFSRTILALVPSTEVDNVITSIEEITGDLDTHDGAAVLILDVGQYRGSMKMI